MSADNSTRGRVMIAARRCFSTFGYHGTSMRDIAKKAGLGVSGLYNHFESKEELLFEFLREATTGLLSALVGSQDALCERRECRLMALVIAQVEFDLENPEVTIVNNHEFRHLTSPFRESLVLDRDRIEAMFIEIVHRQEPEPRSLQDRLTVNALTSITKGMAEWYEPGGTWTPAKLAHSQAMLALRLIDAKPPRKHAECRLGGMKP